MLTPESATNSLCSGLVVDAASKIHSSESGRNVAFSFFELEEILGKSLLSFSLHLRSVLKFQSVGTALLKKFDLYFIQRWTFAFSDVCLTQRSSCGSYSSNWSQDFWALPWSRCRFRRLDVLRCTTELSYIFHYCVLPL